MLADGMIKTIAIPCAYLWHGFFEGAEQGITGCDTPLDYQVLRRNYSHEGKELKDDMPALLGYCLSFSLGTLSSAVPWALTRGARAAYDFAKQRNG